MIVAAALVASTFVAWRVERPQRADDAFAQASVAHEPLAQSPTPEWLQRALENSKAYSVRSGDLDAEFRRLWDDADPRPLEPEQARQVLAELQERLAVVSKLYEGELAATREVDARTWRVAQECALHEALFQLECFERGEYRRSGLAGLPSDLRYGVSADFRVSEFLSRSAQSLLLFPLERGRQSSLFETKTYLVVSDQARR